MSALKKIFTVIDDVPSITPIGINIPCFKKLYNQDKTADKSSYASSLAYMYHITAFTSPYFDAKNKEQVVAEKFLGTKNFKPSTALIECIKECKERESTPEIRALESAINLCDSVADLSSNLDNEKRQFDALLKNIDEAIKNEEDLTEKIKLMESKQKLQKSAVDTAKTAVEIINKLKSAVTDLSKLKEDAMKSLASIDSSTKSLSNFMVDDFIEKY